MQAKTVLHKVVTQVSCGMHARRRTALEALVWSAMRGQALTVTDLGRGLEGDAREKHCIKRADRLLSNSHLQSEREALYGRLCRWLIGAEVHPVILVDWSDLDATKGFQVLRASLAVAGRALTLYEAVHGRETALKAAAERAFLETLQQCLPAGCCPIVVADAGFRTPWFKAVEALGWYWVARIRHRHLVQFEAGGSWTAVKALHEQANKTPRLLGDVRLTQGNPHACRLVVYRGEAHGRHRLTRFGKRAQSRASEKQAQGGREPWVLATNLPDRITLAHKVVRLYASRMQIEEAFRDLKSTRFGLGFEQHRTTRSERLGVLLLIAALALMVLWLIGAAAREHRQARHYQANTVRTHPVLSVIFLGSRLCQRPCEALTVEAVLDAVTLILPLNQHCARVETA